MLMGTFEVWVAAYALRIRFCPMTCALLVSSYTESRQTALCEETYSEADEAEVSNWLSHGGQ